MLKRVLAIVTAAALSPVCGYSVGVVKVPSAAAAAESETAKPEKMTLDDVRELAKKGMELSWADLEAFWYDKMGTTKKEVTCRYPMENSYFLYVKGAPEGAIESAELYRFAYDPVYPRADIRTDDVEAFIKEATTQTRVTTSAATTTSKTSATTTVTSTVKEPVLSGTEPMTLDDVRALAEKKEALTWSDFAAFKWQRIGTSSDYPRVYTFVLEDGFELFVGGDSFGKPETAELYFKDRKNSVNISTGDVEIFIEKNSVGELPGIGFTFDDIKSMTTEEVEAVFTEKGLTDKDFYQVYSQDNTSADSGSVSYSVMLEPESYMINLTGKELTTKVSSIKEGRYLAKKTDINWKEARVLASLGLPEDIFSVDISTSPMLGRMEHSGEYTYGLYCQCSISCKETDPVKRADLLSAALNYVQLNPDFAFIREEHIGGTGAVSPEDGSYIIDGSQVQFNGTSDAVWVLTNDSFDDSIAGEGYKFCPADGGKYTVLILDYNVDMKKLLEQPDMPGVDCTMKSYAVERSGDNITVTQGDDHDFPYPKNDEEAQAAIAKKEGILSDAIKLAGGYHIFRCIRVRGDSNGYYNSLHINASSEGRLFVTRNGKDGAPVTREELSTYKDDEAGIKRFTVAGSVQPGDDLIITVPVTEKIQITRVDGGKITSYELDETVGVLMHTTLKMRTWKQGDVSGDNNFNVADIVLLQRWLLGQKPENFRSWKAADLNGDELLDVFDLTAAKKYLIETM